MGRKLRRVKERAKAKGTARTSLEGPGSAPDASGGLPAPGGRDQPPAPPQPKPGLCGDYGGRTAEDEPCQHEAGWGLFPGAERCAEHDEGAVATLHGYKRAVLLSLEDPLKNLAGACLAVGVAPSTVWRWRQADPAFDEAVVETTASRDALRVHLADDAVFGRILSGKAHAGTEIFWLKNKAPQQFRDRIEHTGAGGQPLGVQQTIMFGDVEVVF